MSTEPSLRPGPLDRLLDATVAPGFTKVGYVIRSRDFEPLPSGGGKTVVITGASTGLGFATACDCAASGASVVMISRDQARGESARLEVEARSTGTATVRFISCDMSDLDSVRSVATKLADQLPRIDALVLNAGVLLDERLITDDGIEMAWATNVVGPYLLEHLLLDSLSSAHGRVVVVTSGGAYSERLAMPAVDLTGDVYKGSAVYARTKRAQIALTELQGEQFASRNVTVHAVHPGWADTPGVQSSLPTFRRFTRPLLRSAEQGADTISWLVLADQPNTTTGQLWHDRRIRSRNRVPGQHESVQERVALDNEVSRLAGLSDSSDRHS